MGRRRQARGRKVDGILVLNKPVGITSNESLQRVKRLFQAQKAGHTGSLDKLASGVLPLCFGEATKLSGFLLDSDKAYRTVCQLGVTTTTGDAAGDIRERLPVPDISSTEIEAVLENFRGEIMQVPPMHSALKHKGERLYKLAYQGIEVEREPRPVTIHELGLLELGQERLELYVRCTKGTYIRTLVEDIGKAIGCGAHVAHLQRTAAGPFTEKDMHELSELESLAEQGPGALDELLLPPERAVAGIPEIVLVENVAHYLLQGQPVMVPKAPVAGFVRLCHEDGRFLGMGEILDDGRVAPRRMLKL